ncbi:MAG: hypothetical protein NC483_04655 [Ruminococcus sp.]|nr:hypothetical protein [Ruminococcus sp.]
MNEEVYTENFVKTYVENTPHAIAYVLEQIAEVHSPEYGWSIGEPEIAPNPDGKTVTLSVKLTRVNTQNVVRGR